MHMLWSDAACAFTRWQHFTAWNDVVAAMLTCNLKSKIQCCQSMHFYLKNNLAKFHPDPNWNDWAVDFPISLHIIFGGSSWHFALYKFTYLVIIVVLSWHLYALMYWSLILVTFWLVTAFYHQLTCIGMHFKCFISKKNRLVVIWVFQKWIYVKAGNYRFRCWWYNIHVNNELKTVQCLTYLSSCNV